MIETKRSEIVVDPAVEAELALVRKSVRDALRFHKSIGNPVVESRDGRIVLVAPEDIVIPDEETEA